MEIKEIKLRENEVIEDLQLNGLRIIRDLGAFTYGTDAVLLARFVKSKRAHNVLDIGTGTGILAILVNGLTGASVLGIDIQADMIDMANRSKLLNWQEGISFLELDMHAAPEKLGLDIYDEIVCNPPYYRTGILSPDERRRQSKHQLHMGIEDICRCAYRLLKYGGSIFLCYPADQTAEVFRHLSASRLEPKRAALIRSGAGKTPYLTLIQAKKGGRAGMIWDIIDL